MAQEIDPSETDFERDARIQAAWDAMSPEERAEEHRRIDLELFASFQRDADAEIIRLGGRDRPLFHGGPGREREVACESAIEFYRGFKEQFVTIASRVRNGERVEDIVAQMRAGEPLF